MAEEKNIEKGVKELEEEITCAICHCHYTDPKVLSCCHYYCKQCIHDLARRTGLDKPFSCPECRKENTLPQGSVDNLQAAFFVNRMKDVHSKLERATGKVEVTCEICSEDKAEAFCRQCAEFICTECVKSHKRMKKSFPGHRIVTLTELQEGAVKDIVSAEPTPSVCELHKDPIKVYCFDCSSLICRDCTIKGHLGHNYEFITVAGPAMKEELIQQLEPLREVKSNLLSAVEGIKVTMSEVEGQGQSVASQINESFDEICQIIESRREELLKESAAKVVDKLENLSSQEKSLSAAATMAQSVLEYTEQCVEHSTDADILQKHTELQARIKQELAEQEKKRLDPVEDVDMAVEVSCVEKLKSMCYTKAKMIRLPIKCAVTVREAEVGEVCEAIVKVTLTNGMPTSRECVINCKLKQLASGATTECEVNLVKGNEYCVEYTPTVRGRHELLISLNGQEVAGGPFPVVVTIDPSKLDKPVHIISNCNPRDVAINSKNQALVLNGNRILIFNRDGEQLRTSIAFSQYLKNPWGMALDSNDDSVYITDYNEKKSKVIKLNSDLVLCATSPLNDLDLMGVAVIGDNIVTCDKKFKVFTKELDFTREIDSTQIISSLKLVSDTCGHLFVCSGGKIHVFDKNYEFLHSFGKSRLIYPYACAISGQYLYVADKDRHCITVFTTEGKYVTSFGKEGSEEGNFNNPCGVCVDRDGFLYVCDYTNKRVQIF